MGTLTPSEAKPLGFFSIHTRRARIPAADHFRI